MNNAYLNVISLIERLHRQFLEVVKLELDGMGIRDINNVQAMVLFNIGDAEMTVGELTLRGCYLGSNVSYNIKKMVEQGYLSQTRSVHDRRSAHVRLSEKGRQLRESLIAMHRRHVNMLRDAAIGADDLRVAEMTLRQLGQFWSHTSDLAQRSPLAAGLPKLMRISNSSAAPTLQRPERRRRTTLAAADRTRPLRRAARRLQSVPRLSQNGTGLLGLPQVQRRRCLVPVDNFYE